MPLSAATARHGRQKMPIYCRKPLLAAMMKRRPGATTGTRAMDMVSAFGIGRNLMKTDSEIG